MTYQVEDFENVELHFDFGPFFVGTDPNEVQLDFVLNDQPFPPLPWADPRISVEYTAPLQRAMVQQVVNGLRLTKGKPADYITRVSWSKASVAAQGKYLAFEGAIHRDSKASIVWGNASAQQRISVSLWLQSSACDRLQGQQWGKGFVADRRDFVSTWIMGTPARDSTKATDWYTVNLTGTVYDDSAEEIALLNTDGALSVSLFGGDDPFLLENWNALSFEFGFVRPDRPIIPHDKTMQVTARHATERDAIKRIPWGAGQSIWQDWNLPYPVEDNQVPPPDPTDPPERRTVYLIMNTLQISDVATGTALDIQGVNISLDIDSISWKFSGVVYGQGSLELVRPDETGMKDISVTINGHTWIFSIDSYSSDERFPTKKFTLSGLSRTQYMANPFAPMRSYTNAIATTAAQAATTELQDTGFTLTWPTGDDEDLPDWAIPAGVLSYRDKSPAQVIGQIVSAAGGVMIPHKAADGWTIQPRYKYPPWQWDGVTPDVAIYIGMIRSRSAKYEPAQAYDACFVSGINQGVSVDVQLAGSGGLNPMPDIFDDLITDTQPAISRGRNELAATGNKVVETLSVLIPESGAPPGILIPGKIIRITHEDEDKDYTCLVLSNSIAAQRAGGAEIYQSVTVERRA